MTPRDLRNTHTTGNSCRDALPCANMTTKTTPVFLPTGRAACWLLLPSSVSLLSGSTKQPGNTYSRILKVTGQVWESQKKKYVSRLSTATTSVQLPKPVPTDLTIKSDSVLTKLSEKMWCEAGRCSKSPTVKNYY